MSIAAIVQARMGSTRLPGKVLKQVLGKPLLGYLIERLKRSRYLEKIVIATTDQKIDDVIADFAKSQNVAVYRGSENDVLDRYVQAANENSASTIVRITADCPLLDPEVVDKGIQLFLDSKVDYVSNVLHRTYPRGMDVEIFSKEALDLANQRAKQEEREHVTTFILRHPELFSLKNFSYKHDYSNYRWTVDTQEDFELISKLIEITYPNHPEFTFADLLLTNKEHPELHLINAHIEQKKI